MANQFLRGKSPGHGRACRVLAVLAVLCCVWLTVQMLSGGWLVVPGLSSNRHLVQLGSGVVLPQQIRQALTWSRLGKEDSEDLARGQAVGGKEPRGTAGAAAGEAEATEGKAAGGGGKAGASGAGLRTQIGRGSGALEGQPRGGSPGNGSVSPGTEPGQTTFEDNKSRLAAGARQTVPGDSRSKQGGVTAGGEGSTGSQTAEPAVAGLSGVPQLASARAGAGSDAFDTDYHHVFDNMYVVNLDRCEQRFKMVEWYAAQVGLPLQRWRATPWDEVDFNEPPIPLHVDWDSQHLRRLTAGELGCLWSHVRLWRDAKEHGYKRVMVLEDDVFFRNETLAVLAGIFRDADEEAARRGKPWHYMFFRRHPLAWVNSEEVWTEGLYGKRRITIAHPSWGTAAYALSRDGIEWLLDHTTAYERPLDVQVSKWQGDKKGEFIALSACDNIDFKGACPETIYELNAAEKGDCGYSGSQSGAHITETFVASKNKIPARLRRFLFLQ